jgi:CBS domain containing-hemolysin-like protein
MPHSARHCPTAPITTPRQLERAAAQSGFSRLPVTAAGGEVLGYLHIKNSLGVAERSQPFPRSALHPIIRVEIGWPTVSARRIVGGVRLPCREFTGKVQRWRTTQTGRSLMVDKWQLLNVTAAHDHAELLERCS